MDCQRFDLEMQINHQSHEHSNIGLNHSTIAILFDNTKYHEEANTAHNKEIIGKFFNSLKLEDATGESVTAEVNLGELMNMIDLNNRWTYKGSHTTPPCEGLVHWNIPSTIYPIQDEHLQMFKKQMERNKDQSPPMT